MSLKLGSKITVISTKYHENSKTFDELESSASAGVAKSGQRRGTQDPFSQEFKGSNPFPRILAFLKLDRKKNGISGGAIETSLEDTMATYSKVINSPNPSELSLARARIRLDRKTSRILIETRTPDFSKRNPDLLFRFV